MKMGWKGEGHGLGKNQQGMLEPIEPDQMTSRVGLGYDEYSQELNDLEQAESMSKMALSDNNGNKASSKPAQPATAAAVATTKRKPVRIGDIVRNIRKVLIQFANSNSNSDLVFDKSLSVDDRKLIHREAHRLGLKTRSEGAETERFLVVRKKLTTSEIFEAATQNGGQISRFQIISKGVDQ